MADIKEHLKPATPDEVLGFISNFNLGGGCQEVIDVFTCGCCYWFAFILTHRFPASELMYDEVENHFATKIGDRVFDITGDITGQGDMVPWSSIDDELLVQHIIRDCINF